MGNVQKVQRGDSPWSVAKRSLKADNKKATNAAIVAEMNRLAKLNGCASVDDFSKKYFNSLGKEIKTSEAKKAAAPRNNPYKPPIVARQDTTAPKNPRTPVDTIPAPTKKSNPTQPAKPQKNIFERAIDKVAELVGKKTKEVQKSAAELKKEEAQRINGMASSQARIIEYNKTNYNGKYYGVIDKKNCYLTIYDKNGHAVKKFTVGVGKNKGDYIGFGYDSKDKKYKESGRYTAPGEFTLDEYKTYKNQSYVSNGVPKIMALKGDNSGDSGQVAIHMVPKHRSERIPQLQNRTNTRVSYGCVNLLEEDYDAMHKYLGEGDKIFILPEEDGNELTLNQQKDGSYKFEQKYHKDQKRYLSKEEASKVNYDIRPERAPKTYMA